MPPTRLTDPRPPENDAAGTEGANATAARGAQKEGRTTPAAAAAARPTNSPQPTTRFYRGLPANANGGRRRPSLLVPPPLSATRLARQSAYQLSRRHRLPVSCLLLIRGFLLCSVSKLRVKAEEGLIFILCSLYFLAGALGGCCGGGTTCGKPRQRAAWHIGCQD